MHDSQVAKWPPDGKPTTFPSGIRAKGEDSVIQFRVL